MRWTVEDPRRRNHPPVLRNHGAPVCGPSLAWARVRLYAFEVAACVGPKAIAPGKLNRDPDAVMARTRLQFEGGAAQAGTVVRHPQWPAALRMLDRIDAS